MIARLTLILLSLVILGLPSSVSAQTQPWSGNCVDDGVATIQGVECLVTNLLAVATSAIGFISFIMLIIGSFTYLMSGGNPKGTDAGKKTITYAVVGIAVAVSAFVILQFISGFTGIDAILEFSVGSE